MAVRPTNAQTERLHDMENNPQLARGQARSNVLGRFESNRKREKQARIQNSMEGLKKETNQWTRKRKVEPTEQPVRRTAATRTTRTKPLYRPRRSRRISVRSRIQMNMERKRLIKIQEQKVAKEAARARVIGLFKVYRALDSLAEAIALCGATMTETLRILG